MGPFPWDGAKDALSYVRYSGIVDCEGSFLFERFRALSELLLLPLTMVDTVWALDFALLIVFSVSVAEAFEGLCCLELLFDSSFETSLRLVPGEWRYWKMSKTTIRLQKIVIAAIIFSHLQRCHKWWPTLYPSSHSNLTFCLDLKDCFSEMPFPLYSVRDKCIAKSRRQMRQTRPELWRLRLDTHQPGLSARECPFASFGTMHQCSDQNLLHSQISRIFRHGWNLKLFEK